MSTVTHLIVIDLDGDEIDSFDVETVPDRHEIVVLEREEYLVLHRTWEFSRGSGDYNDRTTVRLKVESLIEETAR